MATPIFPLPPEQRSIDDPRAAFHRARSPAVYVHVPFCRAICPYCDFNTYARKEHLIDRYVAALLREIDAWREAMLAARSEPQPPARTRTVLEHPSPDTHPLPVPSVYLGGGTPSLLPAELVARIVASCRALGPASAETEVTMEANPGTIDAPYFRAVREAGVNRISLGAQSFQARGLKRLGRGHGAGETEAAVGAARAAGIDNLSLDLMFGWPEQTPAEWEDDLERALALEPDHFSLYPLQVEPGTPFARLAARGRLPLPDDDTVAGMYHHARARLEAAGFRHYEISSWARRPRSGAPSRDHRSRHNLIYWWNAEYLGLGAGAHGFALGRRWVDTRRPERYVARLEAGQTPAEDVEPISYWREVSDTLIMGLRLDGGVGWEAFSARFGRSLRELYGNEIETLRSAGLLAVDAAGVRLTPEGRFVANEVFLRFLQPPTGSV